MASLHLANKDVIIKKSFSISSPDLFVANKSLVPKSNSVTMHSVHEEKTQTRM